MSILSIVRKKLILKHFLVCDDEIPEDCKSGQFKDCQKTIYTIGPTNRICDVPWDFKDPNEGYLCQDRRAVEGLQFKDTCRSACDFCRPNSKYMKYRVVPDLITN